jgi:hydrogenase maturation protein HypF
LQSTKTWHIHIKGQVQGIGFRPFIYRYALKFGLTGWVNNTTDGVHIALNATEDKAADFYHAILSNAPKAAQITSHTLSEKPFVFYDAFTITSSVSEASPTLMLSPDFAICADCTQELKDSSNRRYNYSFTTCTQCGPRYSIITCLPYDRENTSMRQFGMCEKCRKEYNNPKDRRYFSQTNSCPQCPVLLQLYDQNLSGIDIDQNKIISKVCELWSQGKIVAIKSIGGYLLTCDAADKGAITTLRARKQRPVKPFAVMYPEVTHLTEFVKLSELERAALGSVAAPIMLLKVKDNKPSDLALDEIAPGLSRIGVMLPYTPLFNLLLQEYMKPIIVTSGNNSQAPILYKDSIALNKLAGLADHILVNNREIIIPQDDSVVTFTRYKHRRIMIRRARGFAPLFIPKDLALPNTILLATGASNKSSFTLLHDQNTHISQYLGDTANYDTQQNYEACLNYYLNLFNTTPEAVLIDKHPDYHTSQLGQALAKHWNADLVKVQHHEAHFAAVLGEHNLIDSNDPILGVIWDGAGLGDDRQIWGGEFFKYAQKQFTRVDHFAYFDLFLGDKMSHEPRLSAFSLFKNIKEAYPILQSKFSKIEWVNYHQLIKSNNLKTSSVGRLFDAVASVLGLTDKVSYEGEAAMLVEEQAYKYFKEELAIPSHWTGEPKYPLSGEEIIKGVIEQMHDCKPTSEIAAWFHVQLVLAVRSVVNQQRCNKIAFSGGVFQNGLLIDLIVQLLGTEYQLYFNKDLSPNDENISFGQIVWHVIQTGK